MAKIPVGQTLQPTALVHEAWLRIHGAEPSGKPWSTRWQFFAAAAEAMRRILVDKARRKARVKHDGDRQRIDMDDIPLAAPSSELLSLSLSYQKRAQHFPHILSHLLMPLRIRMNHICLIQLSHAPHSLK